MPVAAASGWLAGWRGSYDWQRPSGLAAFVLDSSWALTGTSSGLALAGVQRAMPGSGYRSDLSRRSNRQVYAAGLHFDRDFALTAGQVVSNAAGQVGLDGAAGARRLRFIARHEEMHIWQQRAFGPIYPLVYGGWIIGGAVIGAVLSLRRGGELRRSVMTLAYYDNPFEYWAYRNDRYWPPRGADPSLAWRAKAMAPKTPERSPSAGGRTKSSST